MEWFAVVSVKLVGELWPDAIGSGATELHGVRDCTFSPLIQHHVSSVFENIAAGCTQSTAPLNTATGCIALTYISSRCYIECAARALILPRMAPSKSTRIMILLGIDTAFFFLELIVGYAVHSLALVADSFHMVCRIPKPVINSR